MSFEPLISAPAVIQVHAWAAILALVLGVLVLARPKGTWLHRWTGRCWLTMMLLVVLSSFFIHKLHTWGAWSPIHILSLVTLLLVIRAFRAIRDRRIALHANLMKAAFYNALLLATFFTFLPGRIMHEVIFGRSSGTAGNASGSSWGWILVCVVAVAGGRYGVTAWIKHHGRRGEY